MESQDNLSQVLQETLQRFWGYPSFRDQQEEIITSLLANKDTLALLPTGGGKSLCYQVPALLKEGVALVISPLLALIKDQVYDLYHRGIPAVYLSSELDEEQEDQVYSNLKNDDYKLLYVSPERLQNRKFLENIADIHISFIAVDEAHCISEWGNDFRPSYQNIKDFRTLFPYLNCIALTATASKKVIQEIETKLSLHQVNIFKKSYKRENLGIRFYELSDKFTHILYYLKSNPNSGLIYVRTRNDAENLAKWLQQSGISKVDYYHAGLSVREKQKKQEQWLKSNDFTLVSTNAFGMGIDKDNVSFVIHLSPPPSIENYYQEIGRAGRNGEQAETILLWNENELQEIDDVLKNQLANFSEYQKVISYLYSYCRVAEHEKPEAFFEIQTQKIRAHTRMSRAKIVAVLRYLHNQEIIYLKESKGLSSLELKFEISDLELLSKGDSYFIEKLSRALDGIATHRVYFNEKSIIQKLGLDEEELKQKLKELHHKELVDYFDGNSAGIRFLVPRNDKLLHHQYWNLFSTIQKYKLQKWEEMKYFIQESKICKMKMILAYFGEGSAKPCGKCYICLDHKSIETPKKVDELIIESLKASPKSLDEICIDLKFYSKDMILDLLKELLDEKKIKMLNYKTYTL